MRWCWDVKKLCSTKLKLGKKMLNVEKTNEEDHEQKQARNEVLPGISSRTSESLKMCLYVTIYTLSEQG